MKHAIKHDVPELITNEIVKNATVNGIQQLSPAEFDARLNAHFEVFSNAMMANMPALNVGPAGADPVPVVQNQGYGQWTWDGG
jgi:hypothetical protein